MNNNMLTESQNVILKSFNHYLEEMGRLHSAGAYDEISEDIEDWTPVESAIFRYINGEEPNKSELLIYFGDEERTELVLSYFNIGKYLLQNGAVLNI